MRATIEQLSQVIIFSQLPSDNLEQLQPHTQIQAYSQGEIIFHEGDTLPETLYALILGIIRVSKTSSTAKETVLRTLTKGELFAAPAFFGDGIAPATVTALIDSQILTVKRAAFLDMIRESPEIALTILSTFNKRLQQLHNTVHGLVSERAIVRLAQFIQDAIEEQGTLKSPLPYYQIARSIGITYEECVRLFKQLHNIVTYQRGGKITVLDPDKLEAIAKGVLEA
jgi:CRP/FNR family transcriptional regulator, cyclic AMP receptor protein